MLDGRFDSKRIFGVACIRCGESQEVLSILGVFPIVSPGRVSERRDFLQRVDARETQFFFQSEEVGLPAVRDFTAIDADLENHRQHWFQ